MQTPVATSPRTETPPAAGIRIPWAVLFGVGLLTITAVGANHALNTPANQPGTQPANPATPTLSEAERTRIRSVCFGFVDTEDGVVNIYPIQLGLVKKVNVKENEPVKAGEVLFEMDDRLARENRRAATIDLVASELKVEVAKAEASKHRKNLDSLDKSLQAKDFELNATRSFRDKIERLNGKDFAAKEDLAQARDKVKSLELELQAKREELEAGREINPDKLIRLAEQEVAGKKVQLDKAQMAIDECLVRAPAKGHVLRFFIRAGESLGPNPRAPAAQFISDSPRIVRGEITQDYATKLRNGQLATIQNDTANGQKWPAKVVRIGDWYTHRRSILQEPIQFNDVRTLEAVLEFTVPDPAVKIGQRVLVILHE